MDKRSIEQLNSSLFAEYCCRYDGELVFESVKGDICSVLGVDKDAVLIGNRLRDIVLESDADRLMHDMRHQLENGDEIELLITTKNGKWVFNRGVRTFVDGVEYISGIFVSIFYLKGIYEVQKMKLAEYDGKLSEAIEVASRDSLTSLLNTKTTRELCEKYISKNHSGFALMIIDLDRFKCVNDNYGHIVGDKVLTNIADIIRKLFRNNDIVGRIGGDEFLVLMKDVYSPSIVDKKCQKIITDVLEMSFCDDDKVKVSCSIGAVFVENNAQNYDELFYIADKTMYSAKNDGGNCYSIVEV